MNKRDDGGPAVEIPLLRGGVALVSPEDADRVRAFRWRRGKNGYVYRCGRKRGEASVLMHRFVMDPPPHLEVDHRDGDKVDNRRPMLLLIEGKQHRLKHVNLLNDLSRSKRVHPLTRVCEFCRAEFTVHPDHRGRNRFCSKTCGNRHTAQGRRTHA